MARGKVLGWLVLGLALAGCGEDATNRVDEADAQGDAAASDSSDSSNPPPDAAEEDTGATPDTSATPDSDLPDTGATSDTAPTDASADAGEPFPRLRPERCAIVPDAPDASTLAAHLALPAPVRRWAPLTVVADTTALGASLATSDAAATLVAGRRARATGATTCATDRACLRAAWSWTPDDRAAAIAALTDALADDTLRGTLQETAAASGPWSPGALPLSAAEAAERIVVLNADVQDAVLDRILGEGSDEALTTLADEVGVLVGDRLDRVTNALLFAGMEAIGRTEPLRHEPLNDGENAAARAAVATTDFDAYRFVAILVPGQGPNDETTRLSPVGRERADLAVARYRAGVAPFLLLSGGYVHPDRTPWAESIEMKRYLMETHGVPESAILVDPHARHTTTNLRNAGRIAVAVGLPLDRPILVTSDVFQIAYISNLIEDRAREELGYVPWRSMVLLGSNDACAVLSSASLQTDPRDPLDP